MSQRQKPPLTPEYPPQVIYRSYAKRIEDARRLGFTPEHIKAFFDFYRWPEDRPDIIQAQQALEDNFPEQIK